MSMFPWQEWKSMMTSSGSDVLIKCQKEAQLLNHLFGDAANLKSPDLHTSMFLHPGRAVTDFAFKPSASFTLHQNYIFCTHYYRHLTSKSWSEDASNQSYRFNKPPNKGQASYCFPHAVRCCLSQPFPGHSRAPQIPTIRQQAGSHHTTQGAPGFEETIALLEQLEQNFGAGS